MIIMVDNNYFKVGGSLRYGHPTYITRKADRDIYEALRQKEFCYVLNSRQMGKSSLRVRTMKILAKEGFKCVAIDLGILGRFATAEQWYGGLVAELWRKLRLSGGIDDDLDWWRSHCSLSPLSRFSRFINDVLLIKCDRDIIVFLDEVDNIISLDFRDEFLTLIRNCYEQRVEAPQYNRLTFCLLGVATPSSLRNNKQLSPFNIGKAIGLEGFSLQEAQPLLAGLSFTAPETILEEILDWTKGQPFLTQKLCSLAVRHRELADDIPQLIRHHIVNNWEVQDEPEHLKTIRDRLLHNARDKARFLTLYQQILQHQNIAIDGSDEQVELRLSGLVTAQQGKLKVSNPIYERVFDRAWIDKQLAAISPYQNAIAAWLKSHRQDSSRLLRGQALAEAQTWAKKYTITQEERDFLSQSEALAIQEQRQAKLAQETERVTRKLAQKRKLVRWQRMFIALSLITIGGFYFKSRQTNLSNINTLAQSSEALFASNRLLDSLIAAIKAKRQLNKSWRVNQNLTQKVDTALQRAVYEIKEYDRLLGHSDRLYAIAVANDGKLMATAATDNTVRLWRNSNTGWQADKVLKHDGWVLDVAISPDNKTIASASRNRTVKLWNTQGKLLDTLQHSQPVTSVAIKSDCIITGSESGKINIWRQGKLTQTLTGHTAAVEAIVITSDDKIISASEDRTIKVWQQGKLIKTLTGHSEGVRALAITPDGNRIISGSRDKTLKIWNSSGQIIATLKGHLAPIYGVAVNPHNNQIVSASGDKTIKIWDSNGTEIATLKGHTNRVWDVAYLPNGKIASASWDKTIRLWQPNNNLVKVLPAHQDVVIALDYSNDLIASASDDRTVKLWNTAGTLLKTFRGHTAEVYDVAIHNKTIASVGADRSLKIWQTNGKVLNTIQAHRAAIWAVDISPDGLSSNGDNKVVTAGNDNLIKIWNMKGNLLHTLTGHTQKIWDVAIHPQGDRLASASEDNTLKIWNMKGNLLHTLTGHQDAVRTIAYNSNGSLIVSGSEDRTVKIWQPNKPALTLGEHRAAVKDIAISPDNKYIASVDDDGQIILWQKSDRTWQKLQTLTGHNNSIWSVAFSRDSKTLATAGEDAKVILWNLDSILQLDALQYACSWARNYLYHSTEVEPRDRSLCN